MFFPHPLEDNRKKGEEKKVHVGYSPTRQTLPASRAKRRKASCLVSYMKGELRRTGGRRAGGRGGRGARKNGGFGFGNMSSVVSRDASLGICGALSFVWRNAAWGMRLPRT